MDGLLDCDVGCDNTVHGVRSATPGAVSRAHHSDCKVLLDSTTNTPSGRTHNGVKGLWARRPKQVCERWVRRFLVLKP